MPYIKKEDRENYDERLDDLCFALEEHGYPEGAVTYVLYMIVARWFKNQPGYTAISKIRGCLMGTLSEFDRRYAFEYEKDKINENGDVDLEYRTMESEALPVGSNHPKEDCGVNNCDIDNRGGA
jgi:hypothetical protein